MEFPVSADLFKAKKLIEQLYLGAPAVYRIHLSPIELKSIDRIFDALILRHGLKQVCFEYVIHPPLDNENVIRGEIVIEPASSRAAASES